MPVPIVPTRLVSELTQPHTDQYTDVLSRLMYFIIFAFVVHTVTIKEAFQCMYMMLYRSSLLCTPSSAKLVKKIIMIIKNVS